MLRRNTNLKLVSTPSPLDESLKPRRRKRCKSAPFERGEIARLDAAATKASAQFDKWDKYVTVALFRLGLILLALRELFPTGWEAHLDDLGIDHTRWKRASCLARHFKSEAECRDLSLEEASLRLGGVESRGR